MNKKDDFDAIIESFIERERNISPNPFLSTRVMALINNDKEDRARFFPAWQGIAMGFSLLVAVALGIKAGNLYKPARINDDKATVMFFSDDEMEHFAFYEETPNE